MDERTGARVTEDDDEYNRNRGRSLFEAAPTAC
jgi:hypothetical protein